MSLKTATILAILGASISIFLTFMYMLPVVIGSMAEVIYSNPAIRVCLQLLNLVGGITSLIFFITLYNKQK